MLMILAEAVAVIKSKRKRTKIKVRKLPVPGPRNAVVQTDQRAAKQAEPVFARAERLFAHRLPKAFLKKV